MKIEATIINHNTIKMRNKGDQIQLKGMRHASKVFHVGIDMKNKTDAIYPGLYSIFSNWVIARNWLIKEEWDYKHKVHENPLVAKRLKARGNLLINYFRLCERCHSMQDIVGEKIIYKNAGVWFGKIFVELIGMEVDTLLNPPKIWNQNRKKSLLDIDRNKSRILRNGENPFKEYLVNEDKTVLVYKSQALKILMDCAIALQHESRNFKADYWKPFLKSYTEHIEVMASPLWGRGYSEIKRNKDNVEISHNYYRQGGQGRGGNGRELHGVVEYYKKLFFETYTL